MEGPAFRACEMFVRLATRFPGGPRAALLGAALAIGRLMGGLDRSEAEAVLGLVRRSWEVARQYR